MIRLINHTMYLSVIFPAYNEEKTLADTLAKADKYLRGQTYDYEIIVINDGSKDKTAEIVRGLESQIKNLRLIDNKQNHGKGYVVRQALLNARGDYRIFSDSDNATSIDQVEKLLPYFSQGFDIVIGSRDAKGAIIANPQPFYRRMIGDIFNLMVQIIVGLYGVWDTQCGFKMLSAKAVADIMPKCRIDRWAFDPEILAIGRKKGYKIKEVPVRWVNNPDSHVKMRSTIKMAIDLLVIRWNMISGKYK